MVFTSPAKKVVLSLVTAQPQTGGKVLGRRPAATVLSDIRLERTTQEHIWMSLYGAGQDSEDGEFNVVGVMSGVARLN